MTAALTPALGLEYLRELSADIHAAIVLDAAGECLAGPPWMAVPARALLAAVGGAAEVEALTPDGGVFAAQDDRHAIVIATGPHALPGLARHDLRAVLAQLGGVAGPRATPAEGPPEAVKALLAAAANPTLT